jgi:hypothetical protein
MSLVTTEKPAIMFRVSRTEIRDALKRAAHDDVRSVSTLLEKIVGDWLAAHGYLDGEPDTARGAKPKAKTRGRR